MMILLYMILIINCSVFTYADKDISDKNENSEELSDLILDILENAEVCYNPTISGLAMSQFPETDSIVNYMSIGRVLDPKSPGVPYKRGSVAWTFLDSITYLKMYTKFINGISKYFKLESDIIPKFLSLKISSDYTYHLTYLEQRQYGIGRGTLPERDSDYDVLYRSDRYCSLVFIINFCINQVYTPSDLRTMFLNDLENSKLTVEEYMDMKYNKFIRIYNQYYATDLSEFYIQVCKQFGLQLDHFRDTESTYTIKEPYKSMNDPDLIKIQEYFNEK